MCKYSTFLLIILDIHRQNICQLITCERTKCCRNRKHDELTQASNVLRSVDYLTNVEVIRHVTEQHSHVHPLCYEHNQYRPQEPINEVLRGGNPQLLRLRLPILLLNLFYTHVYFVLFFFIIRFNSTTFKFYMVIH